MAFKPPQKAKRDGNEPEIFEVFQSHGFKVEAIDKPVDCILGWQGLNYLVEIKNGPKAPLTKGQVAFLKDWPGQATVVYSVADAIAFAHKIKGLDAK